MRYREAAHQWVRQIKRPSEQEGEISFSVASYAEVVTVPSKPASLSCSGLSPVILLISSGG